MKSKKLNLYKLKFKSGFHTDSYGNKSHSDGDIFIHSDTLSSALFSIWAIQYPDKIDNMVQSPPFLLSSVFPFYKDILFLPTPKGVLRKVEFKDQSINNKLKKINFIPLKLWEQIISEPEFFISEKEIENNYDLSFCPFLIPTNERGKKPQLAIKEESMRVAIDRQNNQAEEGQLFSFSRVHYPEDSGLWFTAQIDDAYREEFEEILAILGDTGLGGDKNCGNGLFEFKREECLIKSSYSDRANVVLSLSLFCPNESEQKDISWLDVSAYELKKRGGWVHNSSLRRKSLLMFNEGSWFLKPKSKNLKGGIFDVTPGISGLAHPVYRDGRGFFIEFESKLFQKES